MKKRLKAGFIGTGGISGAHLECLKVRDDVDVVALCDTNEERLLKRRKAYGGETFTDFNEMLEKVELDAVWLCTPPSVRGGPLLACADRGIPVLCEKPVGVDVQETGRIAAELSKRKALVQVGYVFRSMPVIGFLRSAMEGDSIHLVQSLYACNVGIGMGLSPWMYDKSKSGGFLVDQATHSLDLLRSLFGEAGEIRGMSANPVHKKGGGYSVEETMGVVFMFDRRILATHNHTIVADGWRNEIVISGEKRIYRLDSNKGRLVVEGNCANPPEARDGELTVQPDGKSYIFQQAAGSIMVYENARFIEQTLTGNWAGNPSTFDDALKTLKLTLECDRAASGGFME